MFDIAWSELLVIAVILIVVVGPKDLPPMLRAFGKFTANLRRMAGEFRVQFDEALREADLDEVRKTVADAERLNPNRALREAIDPLRQMGRDLRADIDNSMRSAETLVEPAPVKIETAAETAAAEPAATDVAPAASSESPAAEPAPQAASAKAPVAEKDA